MSHLLASLYPSVSNTGIALYVAELTMLLVILMMRTWAIYGRSRWITTFILLLLCVSTFTTIRMHIFTFHGQADIAVPVVVLHFYNEGISCTLSFVLCKTSGANRLVSRQQSGSKFQWMFLILFQSLDLCGYCDGCPNRIQ